MIEIKDIKGKIDQMVDRIKNDEALKEQFKKEPIKAVEACWESICPMRL